MSDATEALLARLRAARRRRLQLDQRRTLLWRLPEWEENVALARGGLEAMRAAVGLVEGWEGVQARDLVPAGDGALAAELGDAPVQFTRATLDALLAAEGRVLGQLLEDVVNETRRTRQAREDAAGN